eukprot:scaffold1344_cov388-Prasinococcus_capsulatus_cf.AAC.8
MVPPHALEIHARENSLPPRRTAPCTCTAHWPSRPARRSQPPSRRCSSWPFPASATKEHTAPANQNALDTLLESRRLPFQQNRAPQAAHPPPLPPISLARRGTDARQLAQLDYCPLQALRRDSTPRQGGSKATYLPIACQRFAWPINVVELRRATHPRHAHIQWLGERQHQPVNGSDGATSDSQTG